ncbi:site-specific DNA-methyltransferase (adenine-specific) [Brevinema andersonii]|uniref:Methyltransferase n=1 Tax=Brevinema andersonii TaxID=34097 RepID=A0A1I1F0U4_BREAD|nr:DNA methyltransferase [Brevinema andersonii]SFB92887.1 site-specific DNA-methyltransferase (adenine-specific) [Brevinema andersonii]
MNKIRSPRNQTLTVSNQERDLYRQNLVYPSEKIPLKHIVNKTICANLFAIVDQLPEEYADLIILDPPYNLDKNFRDFSFLKTSDDAYITYLDSWFPKIVKLLKPTGSLYLCGDWKSSASMYIVMKKYLIIRNRITWQREKGRGAQSNWKNSMEDIWFGTKSNDYFFDVDAVKQKRKVIAPYKEGGKPKDWQETSDGNFRLTYPSNFWDDISIPYWSMPENTDHPTQKPEKLIAKIILASCPEYGLVLDPFLGSGTTSVVAKKLNRKYVGIEMNEEYCIWSEKRLARAENNRNIQGYSDGVFWERNTLNKKL